MINYYSIGGKTHPSCWKDTAFFKNKTLEIMVKCGEYFNGMIMFCNKCKDKFANSQLNEGDKK